MVYPQYYTAYDHRYCQVHSRNLRWASQEPSAIVEDTLRRFGIGKGASLLEIGCGEGRDACHLLARGYGLLATDVSPEAISFCRKQMPEAADCFRVLDCVAGQLDGAFDFIYAVAVLHMLVSDAHRDSFYTFIRSHLKPGGIALIGTMGDGTVERESDISTAFALQPRTHWQTGAVLQIAGTSCRMVGFPTFNREIRQNGLEILEEGITAVEPDFPQMMYAVVRSRE